MVGKERGEGGIATRMVGEGREGGDMTSISTKNDRTAEEKSKDYFPKLHQLPGTRDHVLAFMRMLDRKSCSTEDFV